MGETVPAPDEDAVRLAALASPVGLDWMLDQPVLVWADDDDSLYCAARDPLLPSLREAMRPAYPGTRIRWCLCRAQDIERLPHAFNQSRARKRSVYGKRVAIVGGLGGRHI